jgi:hypothetical protein
MKGYWIEIALITVLFTGAMSVPLVQAQDDDGSTVVTDGNTAVVATGDTTMVLQEGNLRMATGPNGSTIVVQPLDAPNNPYRNNYTEFDRWAFENFSGDAGGTNAQIQAGIENVENRNPVDGERAAGTNPGETGIGPGGEVQSIVGNDGQLNVSPRNLRVAVDENGFMVPLLSDRALALQLRADTPDLTMNQRIAAEHGVVLGETRNLRGTTVQVDGDAPGIYYFSTAPMDGDLLTRFETERSTMLRTVLPAMPAWLSGVPADNVTLLPNGEVLVDSLDDDTVVLRYSPEGQVIGRIPAGQSWRDVYTKDFEALRGQAESKGWDMVEQDGYLVFRDQGTREVVAVYDFDGSPLPVDSALNPRPYYFTPLRWDAVAPVLEGASRVPAAGREPNAQKQSTTPQKETP